MKTLVKYKLDLYAQFKSLLEQEKHLACIDIFVFRKAMSLFRCSCHSLIIEKRSLSKQNSREDRLCTECQVLDDEIHALMFCTKYGQQRKHYLPEAVNKKHNFIQILQSKNYFTIQNLAKFIFVIIRTNIQQVYLLHAMYHTKILNFYIPWAGVRKYKIKYSM